MFDDLLQYVKDLKVYALGKGILAMAVPMVAALSEWAWGATVFWPAAVAMCVGGTVLTAVSRSYQRSLYEERMTDFYRDKIASQLQMAPEDVTRKQLHAIADSNPIIHQALDRQRKKTILTISTAALAGAVSLVLLGAFDAGNLVHSLAQETGWLKPFARVIGMGTVAAATSLLVHQGLDAVIGYSTDIGKPSAHDLISKMGQQVKLGKAVTREQVYAVMVAQDEALQHEIVQIYGKGYDSMTPVEQSYVLRGSTVMETMDKMALMITKGKLAPNNLAFMDGHVAFASPAEREVETQPAGKFVERLGLAPRDAAMGYREQLATSMQTAAVVR